LSEGHEVDPTFPDRVHLREVIVPLIASDSAIERVLFVGCDAYTTVHTAQLAHKREYATIDPDPGKACYGAPRHIVDGVGRLLEHVASAHFDAIVMNGVLGFGIDDPRSAEVALLACYGALRPGGLLVLGWNDVAGFRPLRPDDSRVLRRFARSRRAPDGAFRATLRYPARGLAWVHVFDLYDRPG
jgi:SAM-dependent methyltransferase